MSKANIKLESETIETLKAATGMSTGQKAVEVALKEFLALSTRKNIIELISEINFKAGFDPLKLRKSER
jgi:hypothetical protein